MQFWQIAKVSKPKRCINKHSLAINVVGATIACSHIAIFIDKRLTTLSSDGHSVCVCVCVMVMDVERGYRKKQVMNSKNLFFRSDSKVVLMLPSGDQWLPLYTFLRAPKRN